MGPDAEDQATRQPVGYCASRDRYLKRDELGVIYQLCVAPGDQRKLIGASLVKAVLERSAYGCRLYCCWCAQDLDANYFWESLGFVPIAFRAGSTGKKRVHIFWQRRINGDATSWWYPSQTNAGAIREDRLVFPIPPGTHWREIRPPDVKAIDVPRDNGMGILPEPKNAAPRKRAGETPKPPKTKPPTAALGGFWFQPERMAKQAKPKGLKPPRARIDPKHLKATRELRDRYLERVNGAPALPTGKYDVSRTLSPVEGTRQLQAGEASLAPLPKQLSAAA